MVNKVTFFFLLCWLSLAAVAQGLVAGNMFPDFIARDSRNKRASYVKVIGDSLVRFLGFQSLQNCLHFLITQFRAAGSFAARPSLIGDYGGAVQSHLLGMLAIGLACNVLQVAGMIILLASVFVVYYQAGFALTKKNKRDKIMHKKSLPYSEHAESYAEVSVLIYFWLLNAIGLVSPCGLISAQSSVVRDRVIALISRNGVPGFVFRKISSTIVGIHNPILSLLNRFVIAGRRALQPLLLPATTITLILFLVFSGSAKAQPGTVSFPTSLDTSVSLLEVKDRASTTLSNTITSGSTTITVVATTTFTSTGVLTIDDERMYYTAKTSTTFTVVRGQFGSTAAAHTAGAAVRMNVIAAHHEVVRDALIQVETKLGYSSSTPTTTGHVLTVTGAGQTAWAAPSVASILPVADTQTIIKGSADATKLIRFEADGITTGTTRVITAPDSDTILPIFGQIITFSGPTAARTVTFPDASFTVVGLTQTQTLTNKTLTAPVIATIVNTGTLTLPTSTDTLVGKATTDTLTNKTIDGATNVLGSVTMTLSSDATGDIYYRNSSGRLTRLAIGSSTNLLSVSGGLPAWIAAPSSFPVVDTNGTFTGSSDATKIIRFEVDGNTTGTTRVITSLDANVVMAGSASALTSGRVPYVTTGGLITDVAGFLFSTSTPNLTVTAQGAAHVPLLVKGATSQSANLIELQNSAATILVKADASGFLGVGRGATALIAPIDVLGRTISTDADGTISAASLSFTVTKNDSNTRTFSGLQIKPTLNTGGSNANTTIDILQIDTTNTAVTGLTVNLIDAMYGGTSKFAVNSSGGITSSAFTSGRVPYATTGGLLIDSTTLTFNGTTMIVDDLRARAASGNTNFRVDGNGGAGAVLTIFAGFGSSLISINDYPLIFSVNSIQSFIVNNDSNRGVSVGNYGASGSAQLQVGVRSSSLIGAIIRGAASQSANLTEWQNSSATILASINASGAFTGALLGVSTNSAAAAGQVGEQASSLIAVGSAVSLTTATAANITSISLTAGAWDVRGLCNFSDTAATVTATSCGVSSTSATLPTDGSEGSSSSQLVTATAIDSVSLPAKRFNLSGTTTIYLIGKQTFAVGTAAGFGSLTATRVY